MHSLRVGFLETKKSLQDVAPQFSLRLVFNRKVDHSLDQIFGVFAFFGECIIYSWWHFAMIGSNDKLVPHEDLQLLNQHFLTDVW